jgi:formate hydrogenlyase subunit 4
MLSALDVGSSFEGMGSRARGLVHRLHRAGAVPAGRHGGADGHRPDQLCRPGGPLARVAQLPWLVAPVVVVLFILLQAEAARVPVDDPLTHLELTMVHEVMVLDHSGPELAAMQYAAALKMTIYAGLIAALLNPFDPLQQTALAVAATLALMAWWRWPWAASSR